MAGPLWPQLLAETWVALDAGAGEADAADSVLPARLDVTGDPGHLPSRLPVEDTAIACAGAALLAAAAWHERRGGSRPRAVRLDRRYARLALNGPRLTGTTRWTLRCGTSETNVTRRETVGPRARPAVAGQS